MDLKIINKEKLANLDERHPFQVMSESGVTYDSYKVEPCGVWIFQNCQYSGKIPSYVRIID